MAAAEMLRRQGYDGPLTLISADADPPVDRPNLSKDFLAGEAQDDWIPLWPNDFYVDHRIELVLGRRVVSIDPARRTVHLDDGSDRPYGSLLLATGADPVRLTIPGADDDQVRYLRSFADSRAIVQRAATARHVVVVGASFIGLEVAASLRARGISVDVVAPDSVPLERVMGVEVGRFVRSLHEAQGVTFHLGQTVTRVDGRTVTLSGGVTLDSDFLVVGVGVKPALAIAEQAGLAMDRGIAVNEYLETSAPGIFAAGDVARWPDAHTGERLRVEHWVVAERQGQVAARNMLGGARAVRRGAVLLEPALRRLGQVRWSCRTLGRGRHRRLARGARLLGRIPARRADAGDRDDRARSGELGSRGSDGARSAGPAPERIAEAAEAYVNRTCRY